MHSIPRRTLPALAGLTLSGTAQVLYNQTLTEQTLTIGAEVVTLAEGAVGAPMILVVGD